MENALIQFVIFLSSSYFKVTDNFWKGHGFTIQKRSHFSRVGIFMFFFFWGGGCL